MSKIYYGNIVETEGKVPALEIINDSHLGIKKLYLMPFRCYRFQVSNIHGEGDYGSSTVVGLGNLVHMKGVAPLTPNSFSAFASNIKLDSFGKEFMFHLAQTAVLNYVKRFINTEYVIDVFGYEGQEVFKEFIDKSFEYADKVSARYFAADAL